MPHAMAFTKGLKRGLVLQGFFHAERFRGSRSRPMQAKAAQAPTQSFWAGKAPRPDWMPGGLGRPAAQAKAAPGSAWPGAPRPELLPGMGRPATGMPHGVAQRRGAAGAGVVTSPVPDGQLRIIGHGKPLESGIRARMERFFGADLSGVRVHEGPAASAMGALAFTLGDTLHFSPGSYDPSTREGVELLGHELTHVLQQREGRVHNPYGQGVAIVQDPGLEAEADAMGRKLADEIWASGPPATRGSTLQGSWLLALGALGGVYLLGRYMEWWGGTGKSSGTKKTPADAAYNEGRRTWESKDKLIDEEFSTLQTGSQALMHEVSMRNNLTLRQALEGTRVNGRKVVDAVDRAQEKTQGVLCVNFARNLREELFDTESRIPMKSSVVIRTKGPDDMIKTITTNDYAPGTALLYGNEGNMHMTTIVGTVGEQTILVEQHPANPTVLFKTLTRALDEWKLGLALSPPQEVDVMEIVCDLIGIVAPPES